MLNKGVTHLGLHLHLAEAVRSEFSGCLKLADLSAQNLMFFLWASVEDFHSSPPQDEVASV